MKRIFIGGMGRSGTSILLHALYRHGAIYAVPIETKFLVEEDGFDDLITALTTRFSPAGAAAAFARFRHLMCDQATGRVNSKFRKQEHLPSDIFSAYQPALTEFITAVSDIYCFADRSELLNLTRRFIAALFDAEARGSEKSIWAEKTPTNFWRLSFLRELWPDCHFIHAVRDPRAIFLSLLERGWLPPDLPGALAVFASHMAGLLRLRRTYQWDPRFSEVILEDLVAAPERTLDALVESLGIENFAAEGVAAVVRSMDRYYANQGPIGVSVSVSEHEMLERVLLPAVRELGYPAVWRPRERVGKQP